MAINKRKVAIIGAGHVGSHGGYALISQGLVEELVYIDVNHEKAVAQALDLQDSSTYLGRRVKVYAGNYSNIQDADILVVAAGPLPDMAAGQTDRQQTLGATVAILKDIIPQIKASGFDGIIVNISNPADVVTHYLQEKLGWNPKRIFPLPQLWTVPGFDAQLQKKQDTTSTQFLPMHLVNMVKVSLCHGAMCL